MNNVKVFMSSNAANLEKVLEQFEKTATVEAEYGNTVVTGTVATLAHHAPEYRTCPAPCLSASYPHGLDAIGVSHFDLDTLGGVMSVVGIRPEDAFWHVAAFVDVNGPHRVMEANPTVPTLRRLHAFWAWSERNRIYPPRDGSVIDVTDFFEDAIKVVDLILRNESDLIRAGQAWASAMDMLESDSYAGESGDVLVRKSSHFVNHLYKHKSRVYQAIVGFNPKNQSITLSFERQGIGNACAIMQRHFGPKAGGHIGIAGTPRELTYTFDDAYSLAKELDSALREAQELEDVA